MKRFIIAIIILVFCCSCAAKVDSKEYVPVQKDELQDYIQFNNLYINNFISAIKMQSPDEPEASQANAVVESYESYLIKINQQGQHEYEISLSIIDEFEKNNYSDSIKTRDNFNEQSLSTLKSAVTHPKNDDERVFSEGIEDLAKKNNMSVEEYLNKKAPIYINMLNTRECLLMYFSSEIYEKPRPDYDPEDAGKMQQYMEWAEDVYDEFIKYAENLR